VCSCSAALVDQAAGDDGVDQAAGGGERPPALDRKADEARFGGSCLEGVAQGVRLDPSASPAFRCRRAPSAHPLFGFRSPPVSPIAVVGVDLDAESVAAS
jgi:hypothetical protein